jgi:hypothetical protein
LTASSGSAGIIICGSAVTGPLTVASSTGPVETGNGTSCSGSTISGPVTLNTNTGGVTVAANKISGKLSCSGNSPAPGDNGFPNTANSKSGQWAPL